MKESNQKDSYNEAFVRKLENYQNKLLQLRKSNRCICLNRIYNKHNFDLSRLSERHSKKITELVQQSFTKKRQVCILPSSDISEDADTMGRHLKYLARNIKQLEDETGSQYCYFGFPFLEGHLDADHYLRGPLVLFPISVHQKKEGRESGWNVAFSDSMPILNHTLFAALEKIGGYRMNDAFELDFEDIVLELQESANPEEEFIQRLSELLAKNGLDLESHLQDTETAVMENITRDEIESKEHTPLKIRNYKIIGSFPQGESTIYHDYDNLISKIQDGDSDDFIADMLGEVEMPESLDGDDGEIQSLDSVRDTDLNLILESDSSQDQVVLASQNQKMTLVRGPPGTGKSQVIVNIISNALAKRQTVLVVCQKRAALEVVHQRLGEKGLDRYSVLLNKEKEDRAKMYSQLNQILNRSEMYGRRQKNELENTSSEIDKLIKRHSEIHHALSKEYFGGVTVRDLYARSDYNYQGVLNLEGINITNPELGGLVNEISKIEKDYKKFENQDYPWRNRRDFAEKNHSEKAKAAKILSEIASKSKDCVILSDREGQDRLVGLADRHIKLDSDAKEFAKNIAGHTESIQTLSTKHRVEIPLDKLDETINSTNAGIILWRKFRDYSQIKEITHNAIVENSKEKQAEILESFIDHNSKKSLWQRLTDSETKRKKSQRKRFCQRPENTEKSDKELEDGLRYGLDLWNLVSDPILTEHVFTKHILLSDDRDQDRLLDDLNSLKKNNTRSQEIALQLEDTAESLHRIFDENNVDFKDNQNISELATRALNGMTIFDKLDDFAGFVNNIEMEIIHIKTSNPDQLCSHIENLHDHLDDFENLQSYDIRRSNLDPRHLEILRQCLSKMGPDVIWADAVREEFYNHWIGVIEQEHRILKAGHFEDYLENRERLSYLLEKKRELLADDIKHEIESRVSFRPGMGNKRTSREVDYSELSHELGKKRRIKPVRKLIEGYGHILFDIAPCWLASPEMVSNIFPLEKNLFDLIIVDEASQLAAERALPFLYRGERIIIAGDEKQLKPHDLFQIKEEDSEYEDETLDIESLLVLAKRRYASNTLRWHYRSKWQELIDFSNHAFYNGMLLVSPNKELEAPSPPIQWVECPEGMWENRRNVGEAYKVVDVLYGILQDYRDREQPTIGIVTFNDEQRNLIMDRIESEQKENPAFDELYEKIENPPSGKKDDEIFVRNIENVQGDERDIIIFSVGYAKDPEGKFRFQFGTLNQEGGENRLNVAITRASKKIIVVCSIDVEDMKVENAKNRGPRLFRDFLDYSQSVSFRKKDRVEQILKSLGSGMNKTEQNAKWFDSDFEAQVCDRLERIGYSVDTQIGQSGYRIDLGVINPNDPGKYVLGIECDGAMFHSGKSVRERDVTRQKFLERRGWEIERIWSRKWWINPDKEIKRIDEKIKSLLQG